MKRRREEKQKSYTSWEDAASMPHLERKKNQSRNMSGLQSRDQKKEGGERNPTQKDFSFQGRKKKKGVKRRLKKQIRLSQLKEKGGESPKDIHVRRVRRLLSFQRRKGKGNYYYEKSRFLQKEGGRGKKMSRHPYPTKFRHTDHISQIRRRKGKKHGDASNEGNLRFCSGTKVRVIEKGQESIRAAPWQEERGKDHRMWYGESAVFSKRKKKKKEGEGRANR